MLVGGVGRRRSGGSGRSPLAAGRALEVRIVENACPLSVALLVATGSRNRHLVTVSVPVNAGRSVVVFFVVVVVVLLVLLVLRLRFVAPKFPKRHASRVFRSDWCVSSISHKKTKCFHFPPFTTEWTSYSPAVVVAVPAGRCMHTAGFLPARLSVRLYTVRCTRMKKEAKYESVFLNTPVITLR